MHIVSQYLRNAILYMNSSHINRTTLIKLSEKHVQPVMPPFSIALNTSVSFHEALLAAKEP